VIGLIRNKVICECGNNIDDCRDNMRGHEMTSYQILYMDYPKGGLFTYKLSKYDYNGNGQYKIANRKYIQT